MKIYIIDATPEALRQFKDEWTLGRAVVVAINEFGAYNTLQSAINGEEKFTGFLERERFGRPAGRLAFDKNISAILEVGETPAEARQRSRILAWELHLPMTGRRK